MSEIRETRKRKRREINKPNKKLKLVRQSDLRNVLLDNMFVETLNIKNEPCDILANLGNNFESKVYNDLKSKHMVVDISEFEKSEMYNKTIEAIKNKVPIIYQGYLLDEEEGLHGYPDLIIRNDYINKIVKTKVISENNDNYSIIDIKFTTLNFMKNNINLLNTQKVKLYKCQVYIYSKILSKIQGSFPKRGYILGNKWKKVMTVNKKKIVKKSNDCFDRLGVIDFDGLSKIVSEAIYKYRNFTGENEYPNMNVSEYCQNLSKLKYEIAEKNGEITLLNRCTTGHRENAIKKGIYSFRDKRCSAEVLGIKGKMVNMINNIIEVNRDDNVKVIPNKIVNNDFNWKERSELELYVDFEVINDVFTEDNFGTIIYLIGVGYYDNNNKWFYESFVVDDLTKKSEKYMVNKFVNFINSKNRELSSLRKTDIKLFHWGHIERSIFKTTKEEHNTRWNINDYWVDYCEIMRKDSVAVKGCFNYSLKSVGKAFSKLKLIDSIWKMEDGILTTIMGIKKISDKAKLENKIIKDVSDFGDILDYNEMDCKVLSEIINFFRKC